LKSNPENTLRHSYLVACVNSIAQHIGSNMDVVSNCSNSVETALVKSICRIQNCILSAFEESEANSGTARVSTTTGPVFHHRVIRGGRPGNEELRQQQVDSGR
jgi:hypothetical protein